jgi:hypothetical protein
VVLERHQLFEPAHANVDSMQSEIADIRSNLSWVAERMSASGDVTLYTNSRELIRAIARVTRDARQQWMRMLEMALDEMCTKSSDE